MTRTHIHRLSLAVLCLVLAVGLNHRLRATGPQTPALPLARRGKLIFESTPKYASRWVGNTLSCADCHLRDGTEDYAAPLIGVANRFPAFSQRAGHVITLAERIQECFVRSENGKPLPADSQQLKALVAYLQFLSRNGVHGKPYKARGLVTLPALHGNPACGKSLYSSKCALCHQPDGAGLPGSFPPLWGPKSFNHGAGMSHPAQLAAWVQHNMPSTHPGSLTPQQAFDLAAYIDSRPRPKFNPAYKRF